LSSSTFVWLLKGSHRIMRGLVLSEMNEWTISL
jgi:hypothetical protein